MTVEVFGSEEWAAIILAAGYGSRLEAGLAEDPDFAHLRGVPKALLPCGGVTLLDHWLHQIRAGCKGLVGPVLLVTNEAFKPVFDEWAQKRGIPKDHIVSDGSWTNETRLGAVRDLDFILKAKSDVLKQKDIVVIASDLLFFDDFKLRDFLEQTGRTGEVGLVHYKVDDAEVSKRGILEVDECGLVTAFVEKPSPSETTSRKACPAIYTFQNSTLPQIGHFLAEKDAESAGRNAVDAPGLLVRWIVEKKGAKVQAAETKGRFDIGNIAQYKETIAYFTERDRQKMAAGALPQQVTEECHARVGLVGNPSDGFDGKTMALLVGNFKASVTIEALPDGDTRVLLESDPELDGTEYRGGLQSLQAAVDVYGYYGGLRLMRAACKSFTDMLVAAPLPGVVRRGFRLKYGTTIPRSVGLAGSSALITSALRALFKFHGVTLGEVGVSPERFPQVVLDVEVRELGVSAGLMDRVVQCQGGLVAMDFSRDLMTLRGYGAYRRLPVALLPPLFLAYNTRAGGESGRVHSPVRRRFEEGDPLIVEGMQELAGNCDRAAAALEAGDVRGFQAMLRRNFELRRAMYSDAAIGPRNLKVWEVLTARAMVAKSSGSGGAFVCMRAEPRAGAGAGEWDLDEGEEAAVRAAVAALGFTFVRIQPPPCDLSS